MAIQVLSWSANYIFIKITLAHMDPSTATSFRLVLAGLLYVPIFLLVPRRAALAWRDLPLLALLGLFGVFINQGGFTISLAYTSVGHAAIIAALCPVLVLFLAWISGLEALTPAKIIGMVLSFAGIAMLATQHAADSHPAALVGDLLALAGTIGFALFAVLGKRVANRFDTVAINTVSQLTGALLVLPLAARQAVRLDWRRVTWPGWEGLACTVVFGSIVGYVVFFVLLDHLSATQVILLSYLQPIVAAALGVALLHEKIGTEFLLAAVLVLAGVGLAEGARERPAPSG